MSEFKKSVLISFLNKYSILVISIISGMFIARLLTPAEIGVFSVAASFIGIAHTLRDFGVSNYLIQVKEISNDKIRTAFTITAIMAWLIAGLLFIGKSVLANFYAQPELEGVIQILALNFIILPFSSITIALLRREMAFGKIYKITIWGAIGQAATNVLLAYLGYGFYSLAWGGVANVFITALSAQLIMPNVGYFRPSLKGWRAIASFGGKLSISSLSGEAGVYAPDMVIGKMLGFASVGVFSRALGFVSLIEHTLTDALYPVLMPYFSKQNRESRSINEVLINVANGYLAIALPLLGFIALVAYPAIRLLYGSQWDESVPIAQILCLAMAFKSLNFILGIAILSLGYAGRVMRAQLVYQSLRITAIIYGAHQGLEHIATYLVVAEFLGVFVFSSKFKYTDIKYINLFNVFIKNVGVSCSTMLPVVIVYIIIVNGISFNYFSFSIKPLIIDLELLSIKPSMDSQMVNFVVLSFTAFTAMFGWVVSMIVLQRKFLIDYIGFGFLKKYK